MTEKCRICLSDYNLGLLRRIRDDHCGAAISDLMTFLSGIQIKIKEDQPNRICACCLEKLVASTEFKQQILDSEKALIKTFGDFSCLSQDEAQPDPTPLYPIEQVIVDESDTSQSNDHGSTTKTREKKNKKPNELDYKCNICNISFSKVGEKNLHVKADHANDSLCHLCNKKCKTALSLETHIKFHFKDYEWMCEICSKTFRYSNRLEIHKKLHHSRSSMFSCDLCGLTSKFKNNIQRHMKAVHMRLRLFSCNLCAGHEFSTQMALNSHVLRCHGVTEPLGCPNCNLSFNSVSDLRTHEKKCGGFEPERIKKIATPESVFAESHQNSDFVCTVCGESFPTREKLRSHFYIKHKHSNKCDECNIVFNNFPALTRHKKVKHEGHRPFKCDICEKTFGQKVSLVSHRNSHTKEKPLSCPHCPYRSGDYSSISKHKKRRHPET